MEQQDFFLELEETLDRLACGLDAMQLMILGLESIQVPYADGFHSVWLELSHAEAEAQALLDAVSTVRATA